MWMLRHCIKHSNRSNSTEKVSAHRCVLLAQSTRKLRVLLQHRSFGTYYNTASLFRKNTTAKSFRQTLDLSTSTDLLIYFESVWDVGDYSHGLNLELSLWLILFWNFQLSLFITVFLNWNKERCWICVLKITLLIKKGY